VAQAAVHLLCKHEALSSNSSTTQKRKKKSPEIPSHPNQNGYHQENKQQILVRMEMGKELLSIVDGNVYSCSMEVPSKN
jgi:hypothetical protein